MDKVTYFEEIGNCWFEIVGWKMPLKGEHYLGPDMAYKAPNDLSTYFYVVRPTHHAFKGWTKGLVYTRPNDG